MDICIHCFISYRSTGPIGLGFASLPSPIY